MGARLLIVARSTVKHGAFGPVANSVRGHDVQVRHALRRAKCVHFARGIAQNVTNDLCCVVVLAIAVAAHLSNICKEKVREIPQFRTIYFQRTVPHALVCSSHTSIRPCWHLPVVDAVVSHVQVGVVA